MTEEDHYCSLEGAGLTRLEHYREQADEAENARLQREAVEQLRQLREEIGDSSRSNQPDIADRQWRVIEKAGRVVDELFASGALDLK